MERNRFGKILFPDEKNITTINQKVCRLIGVIPIQLNSVYATVDPYLDLLRLVVISAGEEWREIKGLEPEPDIEKLYRETAARLGIPEPPPKPVVEPGTGSDHFPSPEKTGPFGICPKCGQEKLVIKSLCLGCAKAKEGYKTEWVCVAEGCGYDEYSKLFLTEAYNKFNIPIPEGMKKQLGIKTVTDTGEV